MDDSILSYVGAFKGYIQEIENARQACYQAIAEIKEAATCLLEYAFEDDGEITDSQALELASIVYFEFSDLVTVTSIHNIIGHGPKPGATSFKSFMAQNYRGIPAKCMDCGVIGYVQPDKRNSGKIEINRETKDGLCAKCRAKRQEQSKQADIEARQKMTDELEALRTMPYKQYLQTEHWISTRKQAMKRARYKCQLCNSNQNIQVHHRTYENRGREQNQDLIVLCRTCHQKFHDIVEE